LAPTGEHFPGAKYRHRHPSLWAAGTPSPARLRRATSPTRGEVIALFPLEGGRRNSALSPCGIGIYTALRQPSQSLTRPPSFDVALLHQSPGPEGAEQYSPGQRPGCQSTDRFARPEGASQSSAVDLAEGPRSGLSRRRGRDLVLFDPFRVGRFEARCAAHGWV